MKVGKAILALLYENLENLIQNMDEYGIHFPPVQQNKLDTANLKRKREAVATKKQARLAKLPKIEQMPVCCQRICCCGAIAPAFLLEARSKYLDCTTQITRKAFQVV